MPETWKLEKSRLGIYLIGKTTGSRYGIFTDPLFIGGGDSSTKATLLSYDNGTVYPISGDCAEITTSAHAMSFISSFKKMVSKGLCIPIGNIKSLAGGTVSITNLDNSSTENDVMRVFYVSTVFEKNGFYKIIASVNAGDNSDLILKTLIEKCGFSDPVITEGSFIEVTFDPKNAKTSKCRSLGGFEVIKFRNKTTTQVDLKKIIKLIKPLKCKFLEQDSAYEHLRGSVSSFKISGQVIYYRIGGRNDENTFKNAIANVICNSHNYKSIPVVISGNLKEVTIGIFSKEFEEFLMFCYGCGEDEFCRKALKQVACVIAGEAGPITRSDEIISALNKNENIGPYASQMITEFINTVIGYSYLPVGGFKIFREVKKLEWCEI